MLLGARYKDVEVGDLHDEMLDLETNESIYNEYYWIEI